MLKVVPFIFIFGLLFVQTGPQAASLLPAMPASISVKQTTESGDALIHWTDVFNGGGSNLLSTQPQTFSLNPIGFNQDRYVLEVSKNNGQWASILFLNTVSQYTAKSLVNGSYRYRVKACNAFSCSSFKTSSALTIVRGTDPDDGNTNPTTPTLPDSNYFGEISGQASAEGGAANYTIPLALPPGRNGMAPSISLAYNSGSGNGLVGMGWSIGGLSSISRCNNSLEHDGNSLPWRYRTDDAICFNGQRLIHISGNYGQSGSEYRTEQNNITKITLSGANINSGYSYFTVEHADGSESFYGRDTNSTIRQSLRSEPVSWAIDYQQDTYLNRIEYTYNGEANGQAIIESIAYTGRGSTLGNRIVDFKWQNNDKQYISYKNGGYTKQKYLLDAIEVLVKNSKVANYDLTYADSMGTERKLLTNLEYCRFSGVKKSCAADAVFSWQQGASQFSRSEIDTGYQHLYALSIENIGDLDGDGFDELILRFRDDARLTNLNKTLILSIGFDNEVLWQQEIGQLEYSGKGDFNNDGRSDFLRKKSNGNYELITVSRTGVQVIDSHVGLPLGQNFLGQAHDYFKLVDMNRDGKIDLITISQSSNSSSDVIFYENISSSNEEIEFANPYTYSWKINRLLTVPAYHLEHYFTPPIPKKKTEEIAYIQDIDGDGYMDIALNVGGTTPHRFMMGTSISGKSFRDDNYQDLGLAQDPWQVFNHWFDVNGDGLQDWLYIKSNQLYLQLNQGGDFTSVHNVGSVSELGIATRYTVDNGYNSVVRQQPIHPYFLTFDVNNDGRQELLVPDELLMASCELKIEYLSPDGIERRLLEECRPDKITLSRHHNPKYSYGAIFFEESSRYGWEAHHQSTDIESNISAVANIDAGSDSFNDWVSYEGKTGSQHLQLAPQYFNTSNVFTPSHSQNESGLWLNRNTSTSGNLAQLEHVDIMTKVEANHGSGKSGNWFEWDYSRLSSNDNIYQVARNEVEDIAESFPFSSSMLVVKSLKSNDGSGGQQQTNYQYKGAVYDSERQSFQGFLEITSHIVEQNIKVRNRYVQKFPHAGRLAKQWRCTVGSGFNCVDGSVDISYTENTWQQKSLPNGVTLSYLANSLTEQYNPIEGVKTATKTTTNTIDNYGNILTNNIVTADVNGELTRHSISTINDYDYDYYNWVTRLDAQTVTASVQYLDNLGVTPSSVTTATSYEWFNTRKPKKVIKTGSGITQTNALTYDAYGNLKTKTLSGTGLLASRTTTHTITSDGYFVKDISNDLWRQSSFVYDDATGVVTSTTDANNNVTTQQLDVFGRVKSISSNLAPTRFLSTRYAQYADCNNSHAYVAVTTIASGSPAMVQCLDIKGRVVGTKNESFSGEQVYSSTSYDSQGRIIEKVAPHFSYETPGTISYDSYDGIGRPTAISIEQGQQDYQLNYSYAGLTVNVSVTSQELTRNLSRKVNALGQIMVSTDAQGNSNKFRFDGAGNPVVVQDVSGNNIVASYNAFGHKLSVSDPNKRGTSRFVNNAAGEVTRQTDNRGIAVSFIYDQLGRVTQRNAANEENARFYFDSSAKGLPDRETKGSFSKQFYYDSKSRLERTQTASDLGINLISSWSYDDNYGRLKSWTTPSGDAIKLVYNSRGYLSQEVNLNTNQVYRTFAAMDAVNQPTRITNGNGLSTVYGYDDGSRQMTSYCVAQQSSCSLSAKHYQTYSYNTLGYLENRENMLHNNQEQYIYDTLNRLTTVQRSVQGTSMNLVYSYDALGNLLSKSDYANNYQYNNYGPNAVAKVTKNNGTQVNFVYDNNGNMTAGDNLTAVYNNFNKPVELLRNSIRNTFAYGADQMRYKQELIQGNKKTVTYYDQGFEKRLTYFGSSVAKTEEFSYLSDGVMVYRNHSEGGSAQVRYLHKDNLGSNTLITDKNAQVLQERGFDPFGRSWNNSWSDSLGGKLGLSVSSRGFTGHEHLDDVELIHMNGRVYDYNLGRFLSVDPLMMNFEDTQGVNPYSYIRNNPLAGVDPSGYAECTMTRGANCKVYSSVKIEGSGSVSAGGFGKSNIVEASSNGANKYSGEGADKVKASRGGNVENVDAVNEEDGSNENQNTNLNLTQDEYLQAVKDGIWKDAPINPGYKGDAEVKSASDKINSRQSSSTDDVTADADVIEFVRGIAKATAKAKISVKGEKYLTFGRNKDGSVVVLSIGIVSGQGGSFAIPKGTIAAAHVHYAGLKQNGPGPGDHSAVKGGRSMFMINATGRVFEVGRVSGVGGTFDYRKINRRSVGRWKKMKGAK